ncbi:LysR family transcriptional regulator [Variovorax terrae]|uniref:LysR family transcriptional regulator n=1 Tax=Variovorax terrae TaxID=2923278 RepID=A0A9X2ARA8_9BURK|nr:LysR family transcriptional regulator [Variovorax terrae]MCJ0764031.1 LysR family transcriptional regulator [Variovorax terrae]
MNSSAKLMNLNGRQLLAFLEISRLKSFAKAAERIHLSPSGMSMLVKELEDQVGARLFERTTRSVTLTDAGRRLMPAAA